MKNNKNGYKLGKRSKETKHEEKRQKDRSERGFWFEKLSVRKALPLALVLAMVFSIAVIAVSGGLLPKPDIKPKVVQCYVNPPEGNWDDTFTYNLSVIGPREAKFTLEIYQPANNTWEVKDKTNQTWNYTTPKEQKGKDFTVKPFIKQSWGGISSYRFKYEDGILNTILGPYPGPSLPKPEEVEPPHVNFSQIMPTDSNESDYHVYSGDTTAFDYAVNAISNVDRWFDISLRVYDPVEKEWKQKGENKPEYFKAGESKNLTWENIRPFESLNVSKIEKYIGKYSNYTFMYDGNKSHNFRGPKLVVAFKDPEINPEVVSWGDNFTYSINVTACKNLAITLKYYNGTGWNEVEEKNYTFTGKIDWIPITWNCTATDSWEEVEFEWRDDGSEAEAAKMTGSELGVSQLSASKPERSYPVPVIEKEKK